MHRFRMNHKASAVFSRMLCSWGCLKAGCLRQFYSAATGGNHAIDDDEHYQGQSSEAEADTDDAPDSVAWSGVQQVNISERERERESSAFPISVVLKFFDCRAVFLSIYQIILYVRHASCFGVFCVLFFCCQQGGITLVIVSSALNS